MLSQVPVVVSPLAQLLLVFWGMPRLPKNNNIHELFDIPSHEELQTRLDGAWSNLCWFWLGQLIFFTVSGMGLCLGFVQNTVMIILRCFCWAGLAQNQDLFCFLYGHAAKEAGEEEKEGKGGDTARTVTPADPRDIPDHVTSCSVYKVRGKRGHLEWWCLSSQTTITHNGVLSSWKWLNTCLALGNQWVNALFCFTSICVFFFPYETVYISIHAFILPILSLTCWWGSEWVTPWCLVDGRLVGGLKPENL